MQCGTVYAVWCMFVYVVGSHERLVQYLNDGRKIVSGSLDRKIVLWDSRTGCLDISVVCLVFAAFIFCWIMC